MRAFNIIISICALITFYYFSMTYAVFMLPRTLQRSQEQLAANLKLFEQRLKDKEAATSKSKAITANDSLSSDNTPLIPLLDHPLELETTNGPDQDEDAKKEL